MTKTNLALITALIGALIAPQAMKVNFDPLEITASNDGLLTLSANQDVTWLVLDDVDYQIIDNSVILSSPAKVIAISNGNYEIWEPGTQVTPPVRPLDRLAILLKSWIPERNNKVSENLKEISFKIKAGELSSKDMIIASLKYLNQDPKWEDFNSKISDLMDENSDWYIIFQTAAEVCHEKADVC